MQDTEIAGADDPRVLEDAAEQDYVVRSHGVNTMRCYFYGCIKAEPPASGLVLVHKQTPIGEGIDALELIILAIDESEWLEQAPYVT